MLEFSDVCDFLGGGTRSACSASSKTRDLGGFRGVLHEN